MNLLFFLFLCCPEKEGTHLCLSLSKMGANMGTVGVPASRGSECPVGQGLWKLPESLHLGWLLPRQLLQRPFFFCCLQWRISFVLESFSESPKLFLLISFKICILAGNFVRFLPNWIVLLQ